MVTRTIQTSWTVTGYNMQFNPFAKVETSLIRKLRLAGLKLKSSVFVEGVAMQISLDIDQEIMKDLGIASAVQSL